MGTYINFLDESGDHDLSNIDDNFPVFCLAGCIFESRYYREVARPRLDELKLQFWGHTSVILHSRDIRKWQGDFSFLSDEVKRAEFYCALDTLIAELEFTIIAIVILKQEHLRRYGENAWHPYHWALKLTMERFEKWLRRKGAKGRLYAESRGRQPDRLLKRRFDELKAASRPSFSRITNLWMEKKQANIAGLQIADLIAYPIAKKVLFPQQENPAFDLLRPKIDALPGGSILGYGLKIFPWPTEAHQLLWG